MAQFPCLAAVLAEIGFDLNDASVIWNGFIHPLHVRQAAVIYWKTEDFRVRVGMYRPHVVHHLLDHGGLCFHQHQDFTRILDFSFPIVHCGGPEENVNAGRQPSFHDCPANVLGCLLIGTVDDKDRVVSWYIAPCECWMNPDPDGPQPGVHGHGQDQEQTWQKQHRPKERVDDDLFMASLEEPLHPAGCD